MKLMPGVVQDQGGGLHFNGSAENQVQYLLNGFNITDPITGQFHTRLSVEGVRSLEFMSGRYSPEFGKGSAGALAIHTENGADAFNYTATNFVPGISVQQGVRLGNWYPRFGFSGPILKGRAWFSDNFQTEYDQGLVTGLPSGQNTRTSWANSNLLHTQVNLSSKNILFADFLLNTGSQSRAGLGPLDPVSTTSNLHSREYFGSVKDQIYLGRGALIEVGYAHNHFRDSQIPQGSDIYVLSPQGRRGNWYINSEQKASRDQAIVDGYLPVFQFAGSHQIKAGVDLDWLPYNGSFRRTGYEVIGLSGQPLSRTLFQGTADVHLKHREFSSYILDTWRLSKRLQVDLGVREDADHLLRVIGWSPRISFSWSPFASGHTRIAAGYALTYDAINFETIGRPLDQRALTIHYNPDGTTAGLPAVTTFMLGNSPLEVPKYTNWTASVDHRISESLYAKANYVRRRSSNGLTYVNTLQTDASPSESPLPGSVFDGRYQLSNLRRDSYDAVEISIRQALAGQYEWTASFLHSNTRSSAVLGINGSDPLQVLQSLRPTPWDAPNRALAWAYLPLPWKNWAFAILADARSGFPFSVQDETGRIIGTVAGHRYPFNVDLNLAIERMLTLHHYRFALRVA